MGDAPVKARHEGVHGAAGGDDIGKGELQPAASLRDATGRFTIGIARTDGELTMANLRGIDVASLSYGQVDHRTVAIVTFTIDDGLGQLRLPIILDDPNIDQSDYIKIARALLHRLLTDLKEDTKDWDLSATELAELHAPGFPKP